MAFSLDTSYKLDKMEYFINRPFKFIWNVWRSLFIIDCFPTHMAQQPCNENSNKANNTGNIECLVPKCH